LTIQLKACWGGVMLSPKEAKTTTGLLFFQIDLPAGIELEFAAFELVAHEKPIHDLVDFLVGQQKKAPPPAFEIQKALFFGVHMGVDIIKLGPKVLAD
jgi:hypothetical protein